MSLRNALHSKWNPPHDPTFAEASFAKKTVLITGATSGIGLEAAKKIAGLEAAYLIITARDAARGERCKRIIQKAAMAHPTASGNVDVLVWPLDMNSFASVQSFAERVNQRLPKLHVAILNAGLSSRKWRKSAEGWEETLQVNSISTTLLAVLLLPKLLATAENENDPPGSAPHLTFISSGLATSFKPSSRVSVSKYYDYDSTNVLEAMSDESAFPGSQRQYALSKLLVEYSMRHIARLPAVNPSSSGTVKVVVNSACPGLCKSDLGRQYTQQSILFRLLAWLVFALIGRTAEEGSRTYVTAVTRGADGHGKMWKNDRYHDAGEMIEGQDGKKLGDQIWAEMVHVIEEMEPKVKDIFSH